MEIRANLIILTLGFFLIGCPSSGYSVSDLDALDDASAEDVAVVADLFVPPADEGAVDITVDEGSAPEDVKEEKDFPVWEPDWTEHPDNVVQKCLELIPEICNKMWECEIPFNEQIAKACPGLADAGQDALIDGCEELVQNVGPDGFAGKMLKNLAFTELANCIDDYECTQENLGELQEKLFEGFGGGGQSSGGGFEDILSGALPQLLGVILDECGTNIPFGF